MTEHDGADGDGAAAVPGAGSAGAGPAGAGPTGAGSAGAGPTGAGPGPGDTAPRVESASAVGAFLPVGITFLVVGLTAGLDGAVGTTFLVLGLSFLVISIALGAGGLAAQRQRTVAQAAVVAGAPAEHTDPEPPGTEGTTDDAPGRADGDPRAEGDGTAQD